MVDGRRKFEVERHVFHFLATNCFLGLHVEAFCKAALRIADGLLASLERETSKLALPCWKMEVVYCTTQSQQPARRSSLGCGPRTKEGAS